MTRLPTAVPSHRLLALTLAAALLGSALPSPAAAAAADAPTTAANTDANTVHYRQVTVDGIELFYREAGPKGAPTLLLLHGFPASSHMFRDLIPRLADRYHVIAPDYPGYGYSAMPSRERFAYTFDRYAQLIGGLTEQLGLNRYALYVMDYGAPVGYRLATAHPERVTALIVQNGNAYEEGLGKFWDPIRALWKSGNATAEREALRPFTKLDATRWQYTEGVKDLTRVSPDAWMHAQQGMDRPGNAEIQLDLFYDYRSNLPLYPAWQAYFRKHQPPTLVLWGKNDQIFVAAGAKPYQRDLPKAEIHLLDTGHFALETHGAEMAQRIRAFLARQKLPSTR